MLLYMLVHLYHAHWLSYAAGKMGEAFLPALISVNGLSLAAKQAVGLLGMYIARSS